VTPTVMRVMATVWRATSLRRGIDIQ